MLPSYVVFAMEGRARLRHPALRQGPAVQAAKNFLQRQEAVLEVQAGTGSLLLFLGPQADLVDLCAGLEQEVPELALCDLSANRTADKTNCSLPMLPKRGSAQLRLCGLSRRKLELRGMLAAAGLCLGGLALGSKGLHFAAGLLWSLMAAQHTWTRRKAL
jgi:hypothetical protein